MEDERSRRTEPDALPEPTYHLWLKPEGRALELFAQTIRDLARQLDAPVFEPHVTLLPQLEGGEDDHVQRAALLARQLGPFEVVLTEPGQGSTYFQCLFMRAEKTPPLVSAYRVACEAFQCSPQPYRPHLSLVYGKYSAPLLDEIGRALPSALRATFDVNAIHLIKALSSDPKDWLEIGAWPLCR